LIDSIGYVVLPGECECPRRGHYPIVNPCEPAVKARRRTETGEAPRGQGATTENIEHT